MALEDRVRVGELADKAKIAGAATRILKELFPAKIPLSYEFASQLPRDEAGKLRRGDL